MDWDAYSRNYLADIETPYHAHRLAMVDRLLREQDLAAVVDFGCGDGSFLRHVGKGLGIDVSDEMIAQARLGIKASDSRHSVEFRVGGVEVLEELEAHSVDTVMAINSLAYLPTDECRTFYAEANRILRLNGHLIVTHSNELFDMFTFNRYTRLFFARNFGCDITALLSFPNEPDRKTHSVRENPLSFSTKMSGFGFREIQQEFAIPHPTPPLGA